MMTDQPYAELESLTMDEPVWDRFFVVAPLVLVGTTDSDGAPDLAPKHMALPLGWGNHFGFMCHPSHATYRNVARTGSFTVTYPRPSEVVSASLAASPRCADSKPIMGSLKTFPARHVLGVFLEGGYAFLECSQARIIDGFDENALIAGRIVAVHVRREALRMADRDDADVLQASPQIAFLYPNRFAVIDRTTAFPLPSGLRR